MKPFITAIIALILLSPLTAAAADGNGTLPRDSIMRVVRQAEQGDLAAINTLGSWYYTGTNLQQDYRTAARLWATAAKKDHPAAIGNLALCYRTGNGVSAPDSTRAAELYITSIRKGNTPLLDEITHRAQAGDTFDSALLGHLLANGIGTPRDYAGAVRYLTPVAKAGSLDATRALALALFNDKKPREAAPWFRRGALRNDPTCLYYYGDMLLNANGVKADPDLGFVYLLRAAEEGMPAAQLAVARAYRLGKGTTASAQKADQWYLAAAVTGNNRARWEYANILIHNDNIPRAAYFLQSLIADHNSYSRQISALFDPADTTSVLDTPFGHFMLGVKALTVTKDYPLAIKEFKILKKAKLPIGEIMEYYTLAQPGYNKHNYKKAVKGLTTLAETEPLAAFLLGRMYETGAEATGTDIDKALSYLTSDICADYSPALCALGDMYYEGRLVERDRTKAADYYRTAYRLNVMTAASAGRYADMLRDTDPTLADTIIARHFPGSIDTLCKLIK